MRLEQLTNIGSAYLSGCGISSDALSLELNDMLSGQTVVFGRETLGERTSLIPNWLAKPLWRESLIMDIAGYANRATGWDGFSASPIHPVAIADARQFIELLPVEVPPPMDQPCSDGEVSLVWRCGASFAEISFPGDHTFYWYCTNGSEEDDSEGVPVSEGLPGALSQIMDFHVERANSVKTSHAPLGLEITELSAMLGLYAQSEVPTKTSRAPAGYRELSLAA